MWEIITEDFQPAIGSIHKLRMCVYVDDSFGADDEYDEFVLRWVGNKFVTKYGMEYDMIDFDDVWTEEELK